MPAARIRETIAKCLAEVELSSVDDQEKALQTLYSVSKVSPQNRNLLAQTENAIPSILRLTKASSSFIQILSLSILFNLSLNPDLKPSLSEMGIISHLNSIIVSPLSSQSLRLASSLVCSLAMLDKNKAKFGVAGTVQVIIKAIAGPRGPAAHHLLSSLAELMQFHGNCTLAVRSGAVEVLLKVVESPDGDDLTGISLAVLSLLARFNEGLIAITKTEHIVSSMVDVLKGTCMLSKEGAADILVRLFDESEGCVRDALRLPDITVMLADLSVRGSSRAREKAALLMKKLTDANYGYVDGDALFLKW
ncbi:hypothetical protein K2173_025990 [Erythroxylum novogranatense]|uniref:U-box domain-containing protein n=1 Tax=Erythroxylum novogranatense TaxID=1862640 RepID=A0AAV8SHW0_9ROSI|nr:hypothetical protein K2173_025990 [Erythroxylum novogranatense]